MAATRLGRESSGGQGNFLKRWGGKSMSLNSDMLNLNVESFLNQLGVGKYLR